jgi:hypothetical protein
MLVIATMLLAIVSAVHPPFFPYLTDSLPSGVVRVPVDTTTGQVTFQIGSSNQSLYLTPWMNTDVTIIA